MSSWLAHESLEQLSPDFRDCSSTGGLARRALDAGFHLLPGFGRDLLCSLLHLDKIQEASAKAVFNIMNRVGDLIRPVCDLSLERFSLAALLHSLEQSLIVAVYEFAALCVSL